MKKALLIKNPRAGKNSKRINTGDIIRAFKEYDIECFEKTTTCSGDATVIAEKYACEYDLVACCGGDGTYNEVVNGVLNAGCDKPIIYLPCGSTNDFANSIGLSSDPQKAVQMYLHDLIHQFDVGKFNERFFTYIASFGVATDISYNTSQNIKNVLGHSAYLINGFILKLIPMLAKVKPLHMKVAYDGGEIDDNFYFGAIANTNEISGLFKLDNCDVKMNDGLFELLLIKGKNVTDVISAFFKALRQDYTGENVVFVKTGNVQITSDEEIPWTLDGEYGGAHSEMNISVCKNAINVVSPKNKFLI